MVQELTTKPDLFGRFGQGFSQGLAEQVPKEIENYRLKTGLKSLADEADQGKLSPSQYLAKASGTYGATPQMIQSFAELAKQQQVRDAYGKKRSNRLTSQQENTDVKGQVEKIKEDYENSRNQQRPLNNQTIPSNQPRAQEAISNPPAAQENPLNAKYIPSSPWNQERDEQAINEAFESGKARTFDEARTYADRQRQLYENSPAKYQEQLDYRKGVDEDVNNKFDKQLQTRLQKEGKETYKDIPGDMQLNIKKQARNAVATGKMTPEEAAEYYSKKALDLTKDTGKVIEIANRDLYDRLLPSKKEETVKRLTHIGKNFADMGSSEDYYNLLKTDTINEIGNQEGMGLSAGGAASIAYPPSGKVKDLIKNTKISSRTPSESTRDFAQKLANNMTPNDSFLGIARQMKEKDDNFDENSFFDFLRENDEIYGKNTRLNREVTEGVSDFLPNWRDIGLFPVFSRPKGNKKILKSGAR